MFSWHLISTITTYCKYYKIKATKIVDSARYHFIFYYYLFGQSFDSRQDKDKYPACFRTNPVQQKFFKNIPLSLHLTQLNTNGLLMKDSDLNVPMVLKHTSEHNHPY